MKRRFFLRAGGIAALSPIIGKAASDVGEQPNFIFILSDDQDWTGLSVQMHPDMPNSRSNEIETPNLEELAKQGMVFSAAYAPAPVCSPTRISLQTGKNPARLRWTKASSPVRASDNFKMIGADCVRQISDDEITIAEMLKRAGYATAHFGKWHISGGGPERHGYDESDGDTGNRDAVPHVAPNPSDIFGMTKRANAFMEKNTKAGKPFFIQLSHHALHYPEHALPETLAKYERLTGGSRNDKNVQRMAISENLDSGVGLIMRKLDELGIGNRTYLIYMSDNGGGGAGGGKSREGGSGRQDRKKGKRERRPLTLGKGCVWEGGIRVPLIVRGPGVTAGIYCHERVVGYDFYPTLCALANVHDPLPEGVEGGNIAPLFANGTGTVKRPLKEMIFHFPHYQADTPHSAILVDNYKLIKWYETGKVKLFDLSKDIGENNDLAKKMPGKTAELKRRLERYLKDVKANFPTPNTEYDPSKPSRERKGKKGNDENTNRKGRRKGENRPGRRIRAPMQNSLP